MLLRCSFHRVFECQNSVLSIRIGFQSRFFTAAIYELITKILYMLKQMKKLNFTMHLEIFLVRNHFQLYFECMDFFFNLFHSKFIKIFEQRFFNQNYFVNYFCTFKIQIFIFFPHKIQYTFNQCVNNCIYNFFYKCDSISLFFYRHSHLF